MQDANNNKPSTNGAWAFAEEFFEVYDNIVFKAVKFLFKVLYS